MLQHRLSVITNSFTLSPPVLQACGPLATDVCDCGLCVVLWSDQYQDHLHLQGKDGYKEVAEMSRDISGQPDTGQ